MEDRLRSAFHAGARALNDFGDACAGELAELGRETARRLRAGSKLLAFGNGGSAAEAQHLAAELVNRFRRDRAPLPAVALTTDTSVLTSIANDYGFAQIFERQVGSLARAGDIAVGFSTSGVSENVIRGLGAAKALGCLCVGLTGGDSGGMGPVSDYLFRAPTADVARIQECHLAWTHALCGLVEELVFGEGAA